MHLPREKGVFGRTFTQFVAVESESVSATIKKVEIEIKSEFSKDMRPPITFEKPHIPHTKSLNELNSSNFNGFS